MRKMLKKECENKSMKYLTLMRKIRSEVRERKTDLTVRYRKKSRTLELNQKKRRREENKDRSTREDRNIQRLCNI